MKFIKKIASTCAVITVAMTVFAGCTGKNDDKKTDPSSSNNTQSNSEVQTSESTAVKQADPNDGRPLIVIIAPDDPMKAVGANYASYAVDNAGYKPEIMLHKGTVEDEAKLFDSAIEKKAQAIICDVASSMLSGEAINKAKVNNIPTFVMNDLLIQEGVAINQFVTNNYETTKEAALKYVEKAGQLGKFATLWGPDETNSSDVRVAAYTEVLAQYTGLELVGYENFMSNEYEKSFKEFFTANKDLKGVLCASEETTLAALKVKKDMGLKDLVVVGYGGSNEIKAAIESGDLTAAVLPPVTIVSDMAAERAAGFLKDRTQEFEEIQTIESILLTAENVSKLDNYVYTEQ